MSTKGKFVINHEDDAQRSQVAEAVASSPDEQLLSQICEQWKEHQVTMVMVRDILMYMDRTRGAPRGLLMHRPLS
ncbi:hypothetical protein JL722_4054 [Aureococcus anophagefferens]|nr:hypothetical protein JL722_4054 [Aureococcus anophagefferens]